VCSYTTTTTTGACVTGLAGRCSAGTYACTGAGVLSCTQTLASTTETCNGIDDNCNGTVDEGNPGGGAGCSSGGTGTCVNSGTINCVGGSLVCSATPRTSGACTLGGSSSGYTRAASPIGWIEGCTGTYTNLLPSLDDSATTYTLPFSFTFYGTTFGAGTTLGVSSNGLIGFPTASSGLGNSAFPGGITNYGLTNTIAAFWDDLYTRDPGVCVRAIGGAPNRQLIIQWNNTYHYGDTAGSYYFQVVLTESTNTIDLRFNSMSGGSYFDGNSATVGIVQNATVYDQVSSDAAGSVYSGLSYRWTPGAPGLCSSTGSCNPCTPVTYYRDNDGDGYGAGAATTSCTGVPAGYVTNANDCDDTNAAISPVAAETCNNLDDNCNGTVDDRPIANDCPSRATEISLASYSGQVTVTGNNAGATTDQSACATSNYDVFYSFTLSRRELVYVDTYGTGYDSVISILNSGFGQVVCNDDSCSTNQSQVVTVLDPGTYYLRYAGWSTNSGPFTINIQHIPASVSVFTFNAASQTYSGNTTGAGDNVGFNTCQNNGGLDHTYYWTTCPTYGGGTVNATTCSRATWDTYLRFMDGRSGAQACTDDSCSLQSTLAGATASAGAGVRAMYVDGFSSSSFGAYSVRASRPP
jgi:hypothetical protein